MEFPFGHHHNHHHHGREDQDSGDYPRPPYPPSQPPYGGDFPYPPPQNYPPPPSYGGSFPHPPPQDYPPPSQVAGVYHTSHIPHHLESQNYPPQNSPYGESHVPGVQHIAHTPHHLESQNYPPSSPPKISSYESHAYEGGDGGGGGGSHHFRPHMPAFIEGHFHHSSSNTNSSAHEYDTNEGYGGFNLGGYFANKPTFKVYSKAGGNTYSLALRDGKAVLTYSDPNDPTQHWYKDEKYSTKVKDEDGYPSFALVNKSTGQALKHSVSGQPVHLVPYKPDVLDASILWTESKDLGSGFRTIRTVNNVALVLDAFNGDKDHGGVHDGTIVALYKCWKGDNQNQQWKLFPHSYE